MKRWTAFLMMLRDPGRRAARRPRSSSPTDEQRTLRDRIEQRYDVVPLTGGVALRPKSRMDDVRLIEITDTIAVNGVAVSGRELRDRVGADADSILRLSYLDADARRDLFSDPASDALAARRRMRPRARAIARRRNPIDGQADPAFARRSGADLRRRRRGRGRRGRGRGRGRHGIGARSTAKWPRTSWRCSGRWTSGRMRSSAATW